jgi:hypothetical protein
MSVLDVRAGSAGDFGFTNFGDGRLPLAPAAEPEAGS